MPQMTRMAGKSARSESLMTAYLLLVAVLLVPIALSYGIAPATVLPKALDISVSGADQTQIFRALMCLYLAASVFWGHRRVQAGLAEYRRDLGRVLLFSLALGRVISLVVDGPASLLLDAYLALEIFGGLLGLAVLAYARNEARHQAMMSGRSWSSMRAISSLRKSFFFLSRLSWRASALA